MVKSNSTATSLYISNVQKENSIGIISLWL